MYNHSEIQHAWEKSRGLSPRERIVLIALAEWANVDGHIYVDLDALGDQLGYSCRKTRNTYGRLVESGYFVEYIHRPGWGRIRP